MVNQLPAAIRSGKANGFSTIEILVAASILVVVFSAVILLILGSDRLAADTEVAHEGKLLSQKYLEEGRNAAIASFSSDQTLNTTYDAGTGGNPFVYTIARSQSYISPCVKKITVRVDWTIEGRAQYATAATEITSPTAAIALGGGCAASPPPGTNPWEVCASDQYMDINPSGNQARDVDVFKIGSTSYAGLVTEHSDPTSHDLWIYSLSAGGFSFVSSANLVGNEGLSAIYVARVGASGSWYAFLAKNNTNQSPDKAQLRIISLSTISTPTQVGSLVVNNGNNEAKDILYYNGFVYMAAGNLVYKISITTPSSPTLVTSVNLNATVNKLRADNGYLYAATADNNGELKVINLSSMAVVGSGFNAQGNEDGTSLYVVGNNLYLGRERSNNNPDLYVLNVTTPASITSRGSKNLGHTANSYIRDIVVNGDYAFIGSTKEEFEVWNIANPTNIFKQCSPTSTVAQEAAGLDLQDNVVYGAIRSNQAIRRYIDVNNPPQ